MENRTTKNFDGKELKKNILTYLKQILKNTDENGNLNLQNIQLENNYDGIYLFLFSIIENYRNLYYVKYKNEMDIFNGGYNYLYIYNKIDDFFNLLEEKKQNDNIKQEDFLKIIQELQNFFNDFLDLKNDSDKKTIVEAIKFVYNLDSVKTSRTVQAKKNKLSLLKELMFSYIKSYVEKHKGRLQVNNIQELLTNNLIETLKDEGELKESFKNGINISLRENPINPEDLKLNVNFNGENNEVFNIDNRENRNEYLNHITIQEKENGDIAFNINKENNEYETLDFTKIEKVKDLVHKEEKYILKEIRLRSENKNNLKNTFTTQKGYSTNEDVIEFADFYLNKYKDDKIIKQKIYENLNLNIVKGTLSEEKKQLIKTSIVQNIMQNIIPLLRKKNEEEEKIKQLQKDNEKLKEEEAKLREDHKDLKSESKLLLNSTKQEDLFKTLGKVKTNNSIIDKFNKNVNSYCEKFEKSKKEIKNINQQIRNY